MTHRKTTAIASLFAAIFALALFAFGGTVLAAADKVTLCHNTGSETNPWEIITVSRNSWEHELHATGHALHGDYEVAEGTTPDQCGECTGEGCGGGSGGA
jgi:hypothetical protein